MVVGRVVLAGRWWCRDGGRRAGRLERLPVGADRGGLDRGQGGDRIVGIHVERDRVDGPDDRCRRDLGGRGEILAIRDIDEIRGIG